MAFIPSHRKKHRHEKREVRLQLTSMMDMFTIILVFLLKTYSTQGQLVNPSNDLTLPSSRIQTIPEMGLDVTVSNDWILVNNKPVVRTAAVLASEDYLIGSVQQEMLKYANEAEKMESQYGAVFSGKVTIQGDKNIPYRLLMRVMYTCGQAKHPNMRLVVYKLEA
ncbi:biopolymer transporter ExbD [bacterium]|nr:biopolymer transporter ExbD [bacterium]